MKTLSTILIALTALLSISCTQNQRAKSFGGNAEIDLPKGQKLTEITWKEENLWYATRPMREGEQAEVYTFQEDSSFGLIEGTVTIRESR